MTTNKTSQEPRLPLARRAKRTARTSWTSSLWDAVASLWPAARRESKPARIINWRVVIITVVMLAVLVPSAMYVHALQMDRNTAAYLDRAGTFEESKEWMKAASTLQRYLQLKPDDSEARLRWVRDFDKAISAGNASDGARRKVIEMYATVLNDVSSQDEIEILERQAALSLDVQNLKDFRGAVEKCDQILKKQAGHPAALRMRAQGLDGMFTRDGRISKDLVAEAYYAAVDANPADALMAARAAQFVREKMDDVPGADQIMNNLVTQNTKDGTAWAVRYEYRSRYGVPGADADLDSALSLSPNDSQVLLLASVRALNPGQGKSPDRAAAKKYLENAIAADPKNLNAWYRLVSLIQEEGQPDAALAKLDEMKKVVGDNEPYGFAFLRIQLQLQTGKLDDADKTLGSLERLFEQLGRQFEEKAFLEDRLQAQVLRGQWKLAKKDFEGALSSFQPVVLGLPKSSARTLEIKLRCYQGIAQAAERLGRWEQAAAALNELAAMDPRKESQSAIHLRAAQSLEAAGLPSQALQHYDLVLGEPDAPVAAWLGMIRLTLQTAANEEALARVEQALAELQKKPESKDLGLEIGVVNARVSWLRNQPGKAVEQLREVEEKFPTNINLRRQLPLFYEAWQQPAEADRSFAELEKLEPQAVGTLLVRAALSSERKKFAEAEEALKAGMSGRTPVDQRLIEGALAQVAARSGDSRKALGQFRKLALQPDAALAEVQRAAEIAMELKEYGDAETLEAKLKQVEGGDGCLWRDLRARRLLAQSKRTTQPEFVEAEKLATEIRSRRPNWPSGLVLSAQLLIARGKAEEAIVELDKAINAGTRRIDVILQIVELLERQGRKGEIGKYIGMIENRVAERVGALDATNLFYLESGALDRALLITQELAKRKPNDGNVQVRLGYLLSLSGRASEAEPALRKAVQLSPGEAGIWLALAEFLMRQKRPADVQTLIDQMDKEEKLPEDRRHLAVAQSYELMGNRNDATKRYRDACRTAPADRKLLALRRAADYFQRVDMAESIRCWEEMAALQPENRAITQNLALMEASRGTEEGNQNAEKWLAKLGAGGDAFPEVMRLKAYLRLRRGSTENRQEALELANALVKSGATISRENRLMAGVIFEAQREYEKAEAQFLELATQSTSKTLDHARLAEFLLRRERPDDAWQWVERVQEAEPKSLSTLGLTVRWLHGKGRDGDIPKTVVSFTNDQVDPVGNPEAKAQLWNEIGRLYQSIDKPSDAELAYRRVLELTPINYQPLANVLVSQGRTSEAVGLAVEAAKRDAGNSQELAHVVFLCSLMTRGQPVAKDLELADPLIAEALAKHAENAGLLFTVGTLRYFQHRNAEAIKLFEHALRIEPKSVLVLNNLANVLSDEGRHAEALSAIDRALAIRGPDASLLDTKGLILLRKGDARLAVQALEETVNFPSVDPRYYFHLACAHMEAGAMDKAKAALERARSMSLDRLPLTPAEKQQLDQLNRNLAVN